MCFDIFEEQPQPIIYIEEPPEMTGFEKAIWQAYGNAWRNKRLLDAEYPHEDICASCTGCGSFIKENSEEGECVQDRSEGECFHRHFDAQQFGEEVAAYLEK